MTRWEQLRADRTNTMRRYDALQRYREIQRARELEEDVDTETIVAVCGVEALDYLV